MAEHKWQGIQAATRMEVARQEGNVGGKSCPRQLLCCEADFRMGFRFTRVAYTLSVIYYEVLDYLDIASSMLCYDYFYMRCFRRADIKYGM